jgi:ribonuclease HII
VTDVPTAKAGSPARAPAESGLRAKERALNAQGFRFVVGVDEAGRGPLAGPVVAAACYIPPHVTIAGINDSKALSEAQREVAYAELLAHSEVRHAVSVQSPAVIDEINILQATLRAMRECVAKLRETGLSELDFVLVDGNRSPYDAASTLPAGVSCETVVKGDSKCLSIAAASIIAKVTRDRLMLELDAQYPQYDFKQHKGYPTARHCSLLFKHGACAEHRRSFAPVRNALAAAAAAEQAAALPKK